MSALSDTHASAADVQFQLLRAASTSRRLALACSLSSTVIGLARRGLRQRHPELSEGDLGLLFLETHYSSELAERVRSYLERRRP
jgi:hypothetical protein